MIYKETKLLDEILENTKFSNSREGAAWARFERRLTAERRERILAATEMFHTLIVVLVVVTQLYIFVKTQTTYLKWVHFLRMEMLP